MEPMIEYALCFAGLMVGLVLSIKIHTDIIIGRMNKQTENNPEAIFGELEA